jgi:hypothetical protein
VADGPVQERGMRSPALWGLFLIAFGFGTTALDWYRVRHGSAATPFAEFVTPFLGFLGIALLVAPDPWHIIGAQEQRPSAVWRVRRTVGDHLARRRGMLRRLRRDPWLVALAPILFMARSSPAPRVAVPVVSAAWAVSRL